MSKNSKQRRRDRKNRQKSFDRERANKEYMASGSRTVDGMRKLLVGVRWSTFQKPPSMIRKSNVTFRARAGLFLGRPVAVVIGHRQFVSVLQLPGPRSQVLTPLDPQRPKRTGRALHSIPFPSDYCSHPVVWNEQYGADNEGNTNTN